MHCMQVTLSRTGRISLVKKMKLSQPPQTDGPLSYMVGYAIHCSHRPTVQALLQSDAPEVPGEADEVMQEIHAGVCGPHMNGIPLRRSYTKATISSPWKQTAAN
jgi:hypothetical protein